MSVHLFVVVIVAVFVVVVLLAWFNFGRGIFVQGGAGVSVRKTKAIVLIAVSAPGAAVQCDMAVYKAATSLIQAGS